MSPCHQPPRMLPSPPRDGYSGVQAPEPEHRVATNRTHMHEHSDRDPVYPDKKRTIGASRWVELSALLLAGNLANLVSWRLGYSINSGPVTIVLACALYA